MRRILPWVVFGVFVAYLGAAMVPPPRSSSGFDVAAFGRLPVMMNGRVQPIDSVARLGLLQIHGAVSIPVENARPWQFRTQSLGATEWLLELMTKPDAADKRKIFHVKDATLLRMLDLKATARSGASDSTFSELHQKLI